MQQTEQRKKWSTQQHQRKMQQHQMNTQKNTTCPKRKDQQKQRKCGMVIYYNVYFDADFVTL